MRQSLEDAIHQGVLLEKAGCVFSGWRNSAAPFWAVDVFGYMALGVPSGFVSAFGEVASFIYFVVLKGAGSHRTIAKGWLGLRVVRLNGKKMNLSASGSSLWRSAVTEALGRWPQQ